MGLYQISACSNPSTYVVDFPAGVFPTAPNPGDIYFLDFTGTTPDDCYEVVGSSAGPEQDSIQSYIQYDTCIECLAVPTPTPTSSNTPTPTNTATNTPTPSQTATNTQTPTGTPTNTPTNTQTPTNTSTNTPTPTGTPTPTPTPPGYWIITDCDETIRIVDLVGISPTIGEMYLLEFSGATPYGCYFITDTSYGPSTDIGGSLGGPYTDCAECGGNYTGTSVNEFYEYVGTCCESGTTYNYPHPEYATNGGVAIQLNAVQIGGFNGLNN